MVTPHLLDVVREERAMDDATAIAGRALGLDRTSVADLRFGSIDDDPLRDFDPLVDERVALGAPVPVLTSFVGERIPTIGG